MLLRTLTSEIWSQEWLKTLTYKIMTLKSIQIQTGAGKAEKKNKFEEKTEAGEEV